MIATLLPWVAGAAAALAVAVARAPVHAGVGPSVARRLRPGPASEVGRGPQLPGRGGEARRPRREGTTAGWHTVPSRVASSVRRVAGRPADPDADVRLGRALVVGALVAVVHPLAAVVVGGACWGRPVLRDRRAARARSRAVLDGVVDVIDLVRLAVAAGLTVPLAVEAVAPRAGGPVGAALAEVRRHVGLGVRWSEALEVLLELGEAARPLAAILIAAERDGAPLAGPLEQAGRDARLARRRAAETDARRLPVQLLFPLVLCTLPAFGLLTVVPLVVGTVSSLPA